MSRGGIENLLVMPNEMGWQTGADKESIDRNKSRLTHTTTEVWCATRQEDSEILKSFVPPVEQLAGGFFTPLHSSSHGIQQEPSSEVSAEYVSCCSSGYKSLLR